MSEGAGEKVLHDLRYDVDEYPPFAVASLLAVEETMVGPLELRGDTTIRTPAGIR